MIGREKKQILFIGLSFGLAVFLTYFALGLGLLTALRALINTVLLRFIINILITLAALFFFIFTIKDYLKARKGQFPDMTLKLSKKRIQLIHNVIRKLAKGPLMILAAFLMGFIVSLVELACTGQIYMPTLAYLINRDSSASALFYLLVYNIAFIIPLGIVFFAFFKGVTGEIFGRILKNNVKRIKLMMAAFYIFLTIALWIF